MYSHNLKQGLEDKRNAAIRQAQRCESNAEEERIKHLDNIKRSKELREQAAEVQQLLDSLAFAPAPSDDIIATAA